MKLKPLMKLQPNMNGLGLLVSDKKTFIFAYVKKNLMVKVNPMLS